MVKGAVGEMIVSVMPVVLSPGIPWKPVDTVVSIFSAVHVLTTHQLCCLGSWNKEFGAPATALHLARLIKMGFFQNRVLPVRQMCQRVVTAPRARHPMPHPSPFSNPFISVVFAALSANCPKLRLFIGGLPELTLTPL